MLAFKGPPLARPLLGSVLARTCLYRRWGCLRPALPSGEKVQVAAQLLCPVQTPPSPMCSVLCGFSSLISHCNPSLEFDVFSYIERTGATAQKTQQLKTNLHSLRDLHPAQHGKLAEDRIRDVRSSAGLFHTPQHRRGVWSEFVGATFQGGSQGNTLSFLPVKSSWVMQ